MKHLRATVRADPESSPALFKLLAHTPGVDEVRVLEETTTPDGFETYLATVDGDVDALVARAADDDTILEVETFEFEGEPPYILLVHRSPGMEGLELERRDAAQHGVLLRTPVVYRDGAMHVRAIGDSGQLQETIDSGPSGMTVSVEEVGEFRGGLEGPPVSLSDRQREAIEAGRRLGYFEQPRQATHEDVAEALDCAQQTASDHLQKAEAKVISAVFSEPGG